MSYGTPPPPPPPPPPGQYPYGGQPPYGAQPPGYGPPVPGDPGTLDLPWYGIGFVDALKRFFKKYARFDGRASRGEYWWSYLALILVWAPLYVLLLVVLGVATSTTHTTDDYGMSTTSSSLSAGGAVAVIIVGALLAVSVLALLVPSIAIGVRRLHDGGYSGWFYLISFIPCGSIVLLVLLCMPPKPEGARFDRVTSGPPGPGTPYGSPYGS